MNRNGKTVRRGTGKRPDTKRAIVSVAPVTGSTSSEGRSPGDGPQDRRD